MTMLRQQQQQVLQPSERQRWLLHELGQPPVRQPEQQQQLKAQLLEQRLQGQLLEQLPKGQLQPPRKPWPAAAAWRYQ